ncbi:signal peptidase I [Cellulomonas terrae]|uniref:Signal peptidase I n=1 Tax=Cellulomonas terrae TaxID=311234 RepID=A0A511JNL3_9CELL|nr:signal peptidase I [Cellulomonas terrae]GEL99529.1 hypothetical protein CTE05_30760 [Cellulomonas terrae]
MRVLRGLGNAVLWLLAVLGLASVLVWGATKLGYIQPLVVISGSMEPGIMTRDLLVDVPTPTSDLRVGDVASIFNPITQNLVTHRIVSIEPMGGSTWEIRMKGDANASEDGGAYVVGDRVWTPAVQVTGGGNVIATMTNRSVVVPIAVTILALIGLTVLPRPEDDDDVPTPVLEGAVTR